MELDINNTEFQTETNQRSGPQLRQTDETFAGEQSEQTGDQCSSVRLGPAEGPYTCDQSIDTGHQSSGTPSEQTGQQNSSDQLVPPSEPCTSDLSGLAGDQMSIVQSEQTGDQSSSIQSEQTGDESASVQTGPAEVQCGVVVSPHSGTGSLALLGMQYRGNSSDDNCSDR